MFKKKQILVLIASAALVAGCGGGGSDSTQAAQTGTASNASATPAGTSTNTSTNTSGATTTTGNSTSNTGTQDTNTGGTGAGGSTSSTGGGATTGTTGSTGTAAAGGTGTGSTTGTTGGTTSGTTTGTTAGTTTGTTTTVANDQQLKGFLGMVASQMAFLKGDRSIYHVVTLDQFESSVGMSDAASGSKVDITNVTVPTPARSPAAPLASFGFRVDRFMQRVTDDQVVANQTAVGRVAFSFVERPNSSGIGAGQVAEEMRFVIDKVELSTDAKGELISARAAPGAQLYVYGRNAAGVEVRDTIPVPADSVRLLPMWQVMDHEGDTSSVVLLVDLEYAFSQAGTKLTALENLAGQFSMQVTLSPVQIVRPAIAATATTAAVARRDLVGQAITVNDQAPVTGAGVSGNVWIRMYPPQ